ncbi:hypothetical protein [Paenibacillus sp. QZ-Y1]|uniref:hypothetical protein n=1 Tax=Paenibacillus sp. QZ-Y1 TaxID=3414511 RepID=UPI003F7A4002
MKKQIEVVLTTSWDAGKTMMYLYTEKESGLRHELTGAQVKEKIKRVPREGTTYTKEVLEVEVQEEVEEVGGVNIIKKGTITNGRTGNVIGFSVNVICLDGTERQVIKRFGSKGYSVNNIVGQSTPCQNLNQGRYGKELQSWVDAEMDKLRGI